MSQNFKRVERAKVSYRLSLESQKLLRIVARAKGLSQTAALELSIREYARTESGRTRAS